MISKTESGRVSKKIPGSGSGSGTRWALHLITLRCCFSRSVSFNVASLLEIVSTSWQKKIRILMHNSNNTNVFCQCDQLKSRPLSIQAHPGTSNAARRQVRYTRTYMLTGFQAGTDVSQAGK